MASANDPKALGPAPVGTPILDADANMTFAWSRWFQVLYQRVGGGSADPLDSLQTKVAALTVRVTAAEVSIGTLNGEVSALDSRVGTVEGDISLLTARVDAIDAAFAAAFSGVVVTAELTTGGTQGSMTFNQGLLIAQVQAT